MGIPDRMRVEHAEYATPQYFRDRVARAGFADADAPNTQAVMQCFGIVDADGDGALRVVLTGARTWAEMKAALAAAGWV